MIGSLFLLSAALAAPRAIEGTDILVDVDALEDWQSTPADNFGPMGDVISLDLAREGEFPAFGKVAATENPRVDLRAVPLDPLPRFAKEMEAELAETPTLARVEHEKLGTMLVLSGTINQEQPALTLNVRTVLFDRADGAGLVTAVTADGFGEVDDALNEILGVLTLRDPLTPFDELPTGKQMLDSGWEITLPDGYRALSDAEASSFAKERIKEGPFSGKRATHPFTKAIDLDHADRFGCSVFAMPSGKAPEVVSPTRVPAKGAFMRKWARALIKGANFKYKGSGGEVAVELAFDSDPVTLTEEDSGTLEVIELGEHNKAFLYEVEGEQASGPVKAAALYTSFGETTLNCLVAAPKDRPEAYDAALQSLKSIRITDPEAHPQYRSMKTVYYDAWPFEHPALQIWWFALAIAGIAGWLLFRD